LQEKKADFSGKEYYIIYKYIIYFLKGFGEEKSARGNNKKTPAEVAHTGQGGAKAIETHSRNSRADESRMTSGRK